MSEEKHKSRAWVWWVVALLVLYPISVFPAAFGGSFLVKQGMISQRRLDAVLQTVYRPLTWVMERSPVADRTMRQTGESLERVAP